MITVVHIFHAVPEKFTSAFIAFAAEELPGYHHEFVGMRNGTDHAHAVKSNASIAPIGWFARLRFFRKLLTRDEPCVWVFHGMFHGSETLLLWLALFASTDLRWRAIWIIWGGDLYEFQRTVRSPAARIRRFLHRRTLSCFKYIGGTIPGDLELAHVRANPWAALLYSLYINPLPYTNDAPASTSTTPVVLLGNSADSTNEHMRALDYLAAIEGNFEIICPLSYGGSAAYVSEVIEKGKRLFGARFQPLTELLSASDYASVIDTVSYAMFFHNRQQALGNVLSLLCAGKQVYMREDTTGFQYFADLGLDVQPIDSLDPSTLSCPVTANPERVAEQRAIIRDNFGHPRAVRLWTDIFNRIASQAPKHE